LGVPQVERELECDEFADNFDAALKSCSQSAKPIKTTFQEEGSQV
jgi:hypothetical protein